MPYRYPDEPGVHYEEWVVRHRVFHRALVNACGSQWLLGFRDVLHEQSERYRRLSIRDVTKSRDVEAEHAAIVEAWCRRDADAAVDALAKHFSITKRFVEQNAPKIPEVSGLQISQPSSYQKNKREHGGNQAMNISRRLAFASFAAVTLFTAPAFAQSETIRVGLPTKTYWPTTVAETAVRQKLFEKEGIKAELTIYRSGAETFEGMAAGAADISSIRRRWCRPAARRA